MSAPSDPTLTQDITTKKSVFADVVTSIRKCASCFIPSGSADLAPEVTQLLARLHFTNRDVDGLYTIFQQLRQYDPIMVGTLPHEVCVSSCQMLVQHEREWCEKILQNLMELGGYVHIVPWDGFLWVLLQFCTLSRVELCQTLFYIVAKEMKSWTLHLVTGTQLEEFYEDWVDCPIISFDTAPIQFDALPITKYSMVDFIELVSRYQVLLNPVLHLQRSIQQSLPSLRFWSDYDRIQIQNRYIPLDFFRFRKGTTLGELLQENTSQDMDRELLLAKRELGEDNLRVMQIQSGLIQDNAHDDGTALPLPGSKKPTTRIFRKPEEPTPAWMVEQSENNRDPNTGIALGSAVPPIPRNMLPQPEVAKLIILISNCNGLPAPTHAYCTAEIEGRPATRFRTKTVYGTHPVWNETHEIYGYIADETKSLEFNIWDAMLLVKYKLPQAKFFPHGFEGAMKFPGGELIVRVTVTLPKTHVDASEMVFSTFGEEARLAKRNAEVAKIIDKLKTQKVTKEEIMRVQELDFIKQSREGELKRPNMVLAMNRSRPEELVDRPYPKLFGAP